SLVSTHTIYHSIHEHCDHYMKIMDRESGSALEFIIDDQPLVAVLAEDLLELPFEDCSICLDRGLEAALVHDMILVSAGTAKGASAFLISTM
ncbi:hypothetical protein PMAYCL1PPCAC_27080, partial [Pristionchus mayeri]